MHAIRMEQETMDPLRRESGVEGKGNREPEP